MQFDLKKNSFRAFLASFWVRWFLALAWYAVICFLSHTPSTSAAASKELVGGDDVINGIFRFCAHLGVFGVLGAALYHALEPSFVFRPRRYALALFLVVILGVADEIHQGYVPGRHARAQDVITDFTGAVLALAVCFIVARRRRTQEKNKKLLIDVQRMYIRKNIS